MQVVEAAVGVTAGAMPAYHLGGAINHLSEVEVIKAVAVVDLLQLKDYVAKGVADHHLTGHHRSRVTAAVISPTPMTRIHPLCRLAIVTA